MQIQEHHLEFFLALGLVCYLMNRYIKYNFSFRRHCSHIFLSKIIIFFIQNVNQNKKRLDQNIVGIQGKNFKTHFKLMFEEFGFLLI